MNLDKVVDSIRRFGLELFGRYYGPYMALVVNNRDPIGIGRVQVECPRARLPGNNGSWLIPMFVGAGPSCGIFWPPPEGTAVWIFFDNGDPTKPYSYVGGWFAEKELPEEFSAKSDGGDVEGGKYTPERRGLMTPGGHYIQFDDTNGEEVIVVHHKDGKRIKIASDKISIGSKDGSYQPMFMAETVKEWLLKHTHPHSWGPTGPSTDPFPVDGLSKEVENS